MRRENPRPVASFLEDEFDLSSLKRRKRPLNNLRSSPPKESKLPDLIKTVLPDAAPPVEPVKEKKWARKAQPAEVPMVDLERPVIRTRKSGGALQTAGVFVVRWLVMPAVAVIMCLLLYATIDGFIEDWQNDRLRANSVNYSQS